VPDESDKELPPTALEQLPATPENVKAAMEAMHQAGKHFNALGRVAAWWSYFESLVDTNAIELAEVPVRIGVCFTAQVIGSNRKLDAYIALARLLRKVPGAMNKEFEDFVKNSNGLAEQRNRIIHDVWHFDYPNDPQRLEATARKTLRLEFVSASPEDLYKCADAIHKLAMDFNALHERVKALPSTSLETRLR
jgi:hypothetical protein